MSVFALSSYMKQLMSVQGQFPHGHLPKKQPWTLRLCSECSPIRPSNRKKLDCVNVSSTVLFQSEYWVKCSQNTKGLYRLQRSSAQKPTFINSPSSKLHSTERSHLTLWWFDLTLQGSSIIFSFLLWLVFEDAIKKLMAILSHLFLVGTSYFSVFCFLLLSQCTFHFSWHEDVIFVF